MIALLALAGFFAAGPAPANANPPAPPPEYATLYSELSASLTAFEGQIDAQWDGSVGQGRVAAGLAAANGNKSAGLLSATNWTRIIEMLDAFQAMGVGLVKMDIHYPVFTPAFHTYLTANPPPLIPGYSFSVDNFIGYPNSFYNKLVDEIRARGMGVWLEHSTLFNDWSPTPPAAYFAGIQSLGVAAGRARYMQERAAEAVLVASELTPDYYTLVDEPTTQNANFGYFPGAVPILTQDGWRDLAQDMAVDILEALPGYAGLLGAGSGTWETIAYTQRFAPLPELDYVDFHQYPLASLQSYIENTLDWADYVRSVDPTKKVTLGEAWLYKARAAEVSGGLDYNTILGRDVYSFWEPLDTQMLDVLFKIVHYKEYEAVMPFWSQYYFAYLTYGDPRTTGLNGVQLVGLAGQDAIPNIQTVTLTGTGQKFVELVRAAADADGDGIPDSQDGSDSDGDLLADSTEYYCGSAANNISRRPERTDGAFAGVDDDGDLIVDETLPAGAAAYDCDGDGYAGGPEAGTPLCGNGVNEDGLIFGPADDAVVDDGCPGGPPQAGSWSEAEFKIGLTDQDPCGLDGWPSDFASGGIPDSTNRVALNDVLSYVAPTRRINTSPGHPDFSTRWDLLTGRGILADWVNINDVLALVAQTPMGYPPMLAGARAFSHGTGCPWPP